MNANENETARRLLDLPADRQREIAGCLLMAARDKERDRARRAGDAVADLLREKMDPEFSGDSGEKGGLCADNSQSLRGDDGQDGHLSRNSGDSHD